MPSMSDEAVKEKTGRTWAQWFAALDKWGASKRPHPEIASHLAEVHAVDPWWSQSITVEYERARGLRALGQKRDGTYEASVQRKVAAPPHVLTEAWLDPAQRRRWLSGHPGSAAIHTSFANVRRSEGAIGTTLRVDLPTTKLEVQLTPAGDSTVVVVIETRLADEAARQHAKTHWRPALDRLRAHCEKE